VTWTGLKTTTKGKQTTIKKTPAPIEVDNESDSSGSVSESNANLKEDDSDAGDDSEGDVGDEDDDQDYEVARMTERQARDLFDVEVSCQGHSILF
jgi:hypothetical protein